MPPSASRHPRRDQARGPVAAPAQDLVLLALRAVAVPEHGVPRVDHHVGDALWGGCLLGEMGHWAVTVDVRGSNAGRAGEFGPRLQLTSCDPGQRSCPLSQGPPDLGVPQRQRKGVAEQQRHRAVGHGGPVAVLVRSMALRLWHNVTILFCSWWGLEKPLSRPPLAAANPGLMMSLAGPVQLRESAAGVIRRRQPVAQPRVKPAPRTTIYGRAAA